jgi:hypothetical protein
LAIGLLTQAMLAAVRIERDAHRPEETAGPTDKSSVTAPGTIEIEIGDAPIRGPLGADKREPHAY